MRSEEFIASVMQTAKDEEKFEEMRKGIPLGHDVVGNLVIAQKRSGLVSLRNTCVTGAKRGEFIRRLLITMSCVYEPSDACFIILSPNPAYGELLRLNNMDATVPYVRSKSDLALAKTAVRDLMIMQASGAPGYPKLFLVLDGLEDLPDCNAEKDFAEYREFYELIMRKNVEVISGFDLSKSLFGGFPGTFVGIGNCLVTAEESGKADVAYVNEDTSLTVPTPITYPDQPSIEDTISFLNALPQSDE